MHFVLAFKSNYLYINSLWKHTYSVGNSMIWRWSKLLLWQGSISQACFQKQLWGMDLSLLCGLHTEGLGMVLKHHIDSSHIDSSHIESPHSQFPHWLFYHHRYANHHFHVISHLLIVCPPGMEVVHSLALVQLNFTFVEKFRVALEAIN